METQRVSPIQSGTERKRWYIDDYDDDNEDGDEDDKEDNPRLQST